MFLYIETNQLICRAKLLTGFYMKKCTKCIKIALSKQSKLYYVNIVTQIVKKDENIRDKLNMNRTIAQWLQQKKKKYLKILFLYRRLPCVIIISARCIS